MSSLEQEYICLTGMGYGDRRGQREKSDFVKAVLTSATRDFKVAKSADPILDLEACAC